MITGRKNYCMFLVVTKTLMMKMNILLIDLQDRKSSKFMVSYPGILDFIYVYSSVDALKNAILL